jgi:hypothetical protein
LKIKDINKTPPGGWYYIEPKSNCKIEAVCFPVLLHKVKHFHAINNIYLPPDIVDLINEQICQRIDDEHCVSNERKSRFFPTLQQITDGLVVIMKLLQNKDNLVGIEEATRRACICSTCENNVSTNKCLACKAGHTIIEKIIKRKTKLDDRLHVCRVCGCVIKGMVHCNKHILINKTFCNILKECPEVYPKHCWKLDLIKNNSGEVPDKESETNVSGGEASPPVS